MDSKKYAFSEHFPFWVLTKRKVVSGFGIGVLASVIVFSAVLFNVSFDYPVFSSDSSVAWPFSLTGSAISVAQNPDKTQNSDESGIRQSGIVLDLEDTRLGNSSEMVVNGSHTPEKGQFVDGSNVAETGNLKDFKCGVGMEDTHLRNSSEKVVNGSHTLEKVQFVDGSNVAEIGNLKDFKRGVGMEDTHLGNSSEEAKNKSSGDEEVRVGNSHDGSGNGVNASHIGDVWSAEIKNQTILSERSNHTVVSGRNYTDVSFHGSFEKCDLYDGRWVRDDDSNPYYPGGSCPLVDRDFDCHRNRRPDNEFLKWRWKPYGCDIPRINATDFLERLRGKKLVFVGDSLNRNMWESLVCILRQSLRYKKRVFEISGRSDFKKKGFYAFRFEDYDCTVDFVSAPFLVRESSFASRNGTLETLRLDLMDKTTSMYLDADIVIFNTGHWWTHEKTSKGEEYYQEGNHVHPRLKVLHAYRKALTTWAIWVDKHIDRNRTQVIFRGYSPTHFSGGQWNSGGQCHRETEPIMNDKHLGNYPSKMRVLENVVQAMKTPVLYLNISRLTDYRKDGHPSIYRKIYKTVKEEIAAEQTQDCSHWCLPGVPDTWNELLYASLLQTGKGSWKH